MATILESPRATNIVILSIDREFVLLATKQNSRRSLLLLFSRIGLQQYLIIYYAYYH